MSLNLLVAFLAGLATFFSPCMLPVVPGYLAVLSGGRATGVARRVVLFSVGMALSFTALGVFLSWLGQTVVLLRDTLIQLIGVILVLFGWHLLFPKFLPMLAGELRLPFRRAHDSDSGALLLGVALGLAWTPCTGVILGLILSQALQAQVFSAAAMLLSFSAGMVAPLLAAAFLYQKFGRTIKLPRLWARYYNPVVGILVVILGVGLATGWINAWRAELLSTWPNLEKGLLQLPR